MDKYYVPSIEEFHVGFEYEELYGTWTDKPYWKKTSWTQDDFENDHHCYLLTDAYHNGNLRVKHLDREDIESLGWEYVGSRISTYSPSGMEFKMKVDYSKLELSIDYDDVVFLDFYPENNNLRVSNGGSYDVYDCCFNGTIKNKSELKRLLKKLGI